MTTAPPPSLTITVYGTPAAQGSKRHVGGGRMVESSKAVAPWRADVRDAAIAAAPPGYVLTGPLFAAIHFTLHKPASAPKRRRIWPMKKPDIDKLVRSTFDALTTSGVWLDDAQVVTLHATKLYIGDAAALDRPGAHIVLRAITEDTP